MPRFVPKTLWNLNETQVEVLCSVAAAMLPLYDPRYDFSFTLLGKNAEKFAQVWWENALDDELLKGYFGINNGGEGVGDGSGR
jgi:hypothetical protein